MGVDVGGTFTDLVASSTASWSPPRCRRRRSDQSLGVMAALDGVGPRAGRGRGDRARHDGRRRTRCSSGAARARRSSRPTGFRDVIEIGRQNRAVALRPDRCRPAGPLVPRELRFTVSRARRARTACSCRSTSDERRARPSRRSRAAERRGGRRLPALLVPRIPAHERACRARRCARRCPTCTSRSRARCCRSSASTSASRPRPPTPTSAPARRVPRAARRAARRGRPAARRS